MKKYSFCINGNRFTRRDIIATKLEAAEDAMKEIANRMQCKRFTLFSITK